MTVTDISSALLNAHLAAGDLYAVEAAPEYKNPNKDTVWALTKALYGLRGASLLWQDHLVAFLLSLNFERLVSDSSVFVLKSGGKTRIVVVAHVDDLSIVGALSDRLWLIKELQKESSLKHCLRVEKEGDEAIFVGKNVVKVKGGFAVRTMRECSEK